jgi:alpha-N-arabinofuranosidase
MPALPGVAAGIAAVQNETPHYFLGVQRKDEGYEVFLEQAAGGTVQRLRSTPLALAADGPRILGIDGDKGRIGFFHRQPGGEPAWLARDLDGKLLSTAVAGGFVGTTLGVHARRGAE